MMTPYHTKYFAHELTKRCSSDSLEKLAGTLVNAEVDLNPHQVEAALFAFNSPLSKGAILADEVGLGKTIEAGLIISQKMAERKRRVLVITPANLRKQWHQELREKFFLPCRILEAKSYNAAVKSGMRRPFECDDVVICSYQFARGKQAEVSSMPWDLVVIDEAHRLRNVYKSSSVIANALKQALSRAPKVLLTATPLQNSLLELYGLVSFVDEHRFGDLKSFREQFSNLNNPKVFNTLKERLKPICKRTLRQDVLAYVRFTERHPLVQHFTPGESEDRLYNLVSDYLRRDNLQALPPSQRSLMTLVLRKLLASSSFAIAGALETIGNRLKARLRAVQEAKPLEEELDEDYEALDEIADEWGSDDESAEQISDDDQQAIEREIADLEEFRQLAFSITHNAKGEALLVALKTAFAKAEELGSAPKAIIFTESRRTQDYLCRVLAGSPWRDGIVLFNGSNNDHGSKKIYKEWVEQHKGTDRVTGSPTADMRSALVDYFRDQGRIMIATEAGAEGINLQFCSLVVNYDLPWNPQRIEQRIGRCHRYGQQHDVVVVNFLNQKNEADQRAYALLDEKFKLFKGVFGASDEVLGAIESGVDFEKRIAEIYQRCRLPEQIRESFDQLQQELSAQINESITLARRQLLENFDEEVREKLRVSQQDSQNYLNRYERMLMQLTRFELNGHAEFISDSSFKLNSPPFKNGIPTGLYELPRRSGEAHLYRLNHPLAEKLIQQAKDRPLEPVEVVFDYGAREGRISLLQRLAGKAGALRLSLFTIKSLDQEENYVICAGMTDDGQSVDEETLCKLFYLPAQTISPLAAPIASDALEDQTRHQQDRIRRDVSERNARFYEQEAIKLDAWADDQKVALERDIKELDRQIKEARRASTVALTLEEKLDAQKRIRGLETERNQRRRALFDAQDDIDRRRLELITEIEGKLQQNVALEELFSIRWRLA
ncbi:MAG: SNF2-related protein [Acidobacteria bacterium]|nr:SNF2-related protein [Acidobacteriota bacterium]